MNEVEDWQEDSLVDDGLLGHQHDRCLVSSYQLAYPVSHSLFNLRELRRPLVGLVSRKTK